MVFGGILRLLILFSCLILVPTLSFATQKEVTAQQFVDLQQGDTVHRGFRRAHAKGACITGYFESNGTLAPLTTVPIFNKTRTPFIGRFSVAVSNPSAPDLKASVRSLALSFNISSTQQWRLAMNTPPVMAVSNIQDFYKQIIAIKKGPQAISAFFKAHPESSDFLNWKKSYQPQTSFALEKYNSINAFYLKNSQDEQQAVRWSIEPLGSSFEFESQSDDVLFEELTARLNIKPVTFNWVFTLANKKDNENDPAKQWPNNRDTKSAGTLVITSLDRNPNAQCQSINFDPLTLPSGIIATEDSILRARSAAYAESYRRRAKEKLLEAFL